MGIASSLIDVVRAHCLLPALAVVALTVGLDGDLRLGLPEAVAFCGMVLVYNLDQQYADPADLANAPHRTCWRKTYRRSRLILMAAAGAGLLAVAVRTPQLALPLVLGAGYNLFWMAVNEPHHTACHASRRRRINECI